MLFKLLGLVRDELYMLRSLRILLELIVFEPIVPFEAPLALRLNGRVVAEAEAGRRRASRASSGRTHAEPATTLDCTHARSKSFACGPWRPTSAALIASLPAVAAEGSPVVRRSWRWRWRSRRSLLSSSRSPDSCAPTCCCCGGCCGGCGGGCGGGCSGDCSCW